MTEMMITASGLKKSYNATTVLNGIDLQIPKGTVFALLGPNGAGKTTLVQILSTLLKPEVGQATIAGYDLLREPEKVRSVISLTGQFSAVDDLLTGEENMLMMGRLYHLSRADTRRRTAELLDYFDLGSPAKHVVKTYSGGMRRRLDIAISLMSAPLVIFLDEPTTGLDPRSRLAMWAIIKKLLASGITIFLTTQYLEEADHLADQIALIDGGKIVTQGTAHALKQQLGKDQLELNFEHDHDFEKARQVLGHETLDFDGQKRSINVAIDDGVKPLKQILDQMERAEIEVASLYVRKPTLDDVFLRVTGQPAHLPRKESA
jgi:ABC-2 type transport system ATP-binding protein